MNESWPLTALASHVTVCATNKPPLLAAEIESRVQSCWDDARVQHPKLYNGRVFSADRITADRIEGHWTEFRRVLAQMRNPGLYGAIPLRPLAVVGLLRARDGIVIGQRAHDAVYLPGWWQGAPAGNVESRMNAQERAERIIDLPEQLAAECEEELGISAQDYEIGGCIVACEHPGSHIIDIGMNIRTNLSYEQLRAHCERHGNAEYDALSLVEPGSPYPENLVPTLRAMLEGFS